MRRASNIRKFNGTSMADDQKSDREPFWFPFRQQTGSLLASYQNKITLNICMLPYT